jgi:hypothetical protein
MFLNYIKELSVKKTVKSSLQSKGANAVSRLIKTVGLIVDQRHFSETKSFTNELIGNGFLEEDIEVLFYRAGVTKNTNNVKPAFGAEDLKWNGEIDNPEVNRFIEKEFDLLISYYDIEKAILLIVTHNSKAHFKVGFSTIDKRVNNLTIDTNTDNYKVFIQELFKYLKILNKI